MNIHSVSEDIIISTLYNSPTHYRMTVRDGDDIQPRVFFRSYPWARATIPTIVGPSPQQGPIYK